MLATREAPPPQRDGCGRSPPCCGAASGCAAQIEPRQPGDGPLVHEPHPAILLSEQLGPVAEVEDARPDGRALAGPVEPDEADAAPQVADRWRDGGGIVEPA